MSVSPLHRADTLAAQLRDRTGRAQVHIDLIPILAIAIAVTAIGAAVAWLLIGHPPLNGIDDAAITRSYAENIANGYGYVYNIGGERVEGATSVLWTIVVTLTYLVTSAPEYLILAISFGLTVAALYAALNIAELVARYLNAPSAMFRWLMVVALLAAPSFFLWTVWTMMEVALWSAVLLWLIWRTILLFQDEQQQHWPLLVAAALVPSVRPEGIAMAAGLLALAGIFSHRRRMAWIALGVVLFVFASMTSRPADILWLRLPEHLLRQGIIGSPGEYQGRTAISVRFHFPGAVRQCFHPAVGLSDRGDGRLPEILPFSRRARCGNCDIRCARDLRDAGWRYLSFLALLPADHSHSPCSTGRACRNRARRAARVRMGNAAASAHLWSDFNLHDRILFVRYHESREEMHFNFTIVRSGQAFGRP